MTAGEQEIGVRVGSGELLELTGAAGGGVAAVVWNERVAPVTELFGSVRITLK